MNNDNYQNVLGLRAVRNFLPTKIDREDVEAILEAGRWAGSSKNRQDWAFVVLEDDEALHQLATAGRFAAPIRASAISVVLVRLPEGNDFDIGRLGQNMMLGAAARGIASCPVTLHIEDRVRTVLGLPPDHHARYAIAFGHEDVDAESASRRQRRAGGWGGRKPLSELVHVGAFGGE